MLLAGVLLNTTVYKKFFTTRTLPLMNELYIDGTLHFPTYGTIPIEDIDDLFASVLKFNKDILTLAHSGKTENACMYAGRQLNSVRKALRKILKESPETDAGERWGESLLYADSREYLNRCSKILMNVDSDKREEIVNKMIELMVHLQHTIASLKGESTKRKITKKAYTRDVKKINVDKGAAPSE